MPTTSTGADVNGSDLMDIYRMNLGDPNYLPWEEIHRGFHKRMYPKWMFYSVEHPIKMEIP